MLINQISANGNHKDSFFSSSPTNPNWLSHVHHGLAALAISLALNFTPILATGPAFASEFDVLNDGPPKESYVVDDAGVLSRITVINVLILSKADAFEYADQVLERWYPTLEEGNNKGIVVLVTSQKEGAVTGGPVFIKAVGDTILDAVVSQNLPVLAADEKYNEALYSSATRLAAAIDGLPDPGGRNLRTTKGNPTSKPRKRRLRNEISL
ncbi:hypothetical protein L1987_52258 [Smallanthus sonchifolius]|uniref:Uncharacterized protein n=1 Tax=Smallanthus sonchifolius TaxID=185202 RepID=A0ACB9ESY7_9ASTR|nr:hypothetical protein L1987_52258 [Smallanthus sonchifolius]